MSHLRRPLSPALRALHALCSAALASMVGAAQFSQAIASEGVPARERFVNLLKAGGSDYPYPLYKQAGVDLAQPGPYQALMARMNRLMDEFEKLAARR